MSGMVGSRKKVAKLRDELARDVPPDRLAALRGPAGLDIGAIEPEEIALSIIGEIVRDRRLLRHATQAAPTLISSLDVVPQSSSNPDRRAIR